MEGPPVYVGRGGDGSFLVVWEETHRPAGIVGDEDDDEDGVTRCRCQFAPL